MAKIEIDTDLMLNELLPLVGEEVKNINNTLSSAQEVSFPDGGFGWGNVVSNISDCASLSSKYSNWINRMQSSYNTSINDNIDVISKLKIEDINKRESIVK